MASGDELLQVAEMSSAVSASEIACAVPPSSFGAQRSVSVRSAAISADTLAAIAESVVAQPDPAALTVNAGGEFTRELAADERSRLNELMRETGAAVGS